MRSECQVCGEWQCTCVVKAKPRESPWVIRYCATNGCDVRIRVLMNQGGAATCKWCQEGKAYRPSLRCAVCGGTNGHQYPDCWFWLDGAERHRRFALPYWQERIKAAGFERKEAV